MRSSLCIRMATSTITSAKLGAACCFTAAGGFQFVLLLLTAFSIIALLTNLVTNRLGYFEHREKSSKINKNMNSHIAHFAQSSMKKNLPDLRPGDTVRVHQRIREGSKTRIQVFEGVVMAVRGGSAINSSFVVRYVHKGTRVGVEKTFPLHSPNVEKIERLKSSKVRQARLYYLRERFGRAGRMKGEAKNPGDWVESAEIENQDEMSSSNQSDETGTDIGEPDADKELEVVAVVDEKQVNETDLAPLEPEIKPESDIE